MVIRKMQIKTTKELREVIVELTKLYRGNHITIYAYIKSCAP